MSLINRGASCKELTMAATSCKEVLGSFDRAGTNCEELLGGPSSCKDFLELK